MTHFGSSYGTPGWQRAQARGRFGNDGFDDDGDAYSDRDAAMDRAASGQRGGARADTRGKPRRRLPLTIEGELVAKSTGAVSEFAIGDRVFHQKFGNGNVTAIDGNKLTIQFDKAGEKRVVDSFVERV
jgi:DNA helicase-2/ATP-dependent DNA helicase PcrA